MSRNESLLAFDLSNLVIRHAANPYRTDADENGKSVSGAAGALNQIITITRELDPTHVLIAKDGHRSNIFRTKIDASYKAHRPESNDEIKHNFATCYQAIEMLGWPLLSLEGYEADDIMASAARQFCLENKKSTVVSGDKDLLALCGNNITVRLLQRGGYTDCNGKECLELLGVSPDRVCDFKALVGDQSDGIIGIPGIGPKRALTLLKHYDCLDNIIEAVDTLGDENLEGVNKTVTTTVKNGIESAKVSYKLACIVEDIELDTSSFACETLYDKKVVTGQKIEELNQMGLGAITGRLEGRTSTPVKAKQDLETMFDSVVFGS